MTQLRKQVLEELERRNYSKVTARAYVYSIRRFADHFHRSPDQLGPDHVREYQLYLLRERKLKAKSVAIETSALRFFFNKVLNRNLRREELPFPRVLRRQLPIVLSREEVARMLQSTPDLLDRTILMTLYGTGGRRAEVSNLRPEDIDKERMVVRIRNGKGGKDREVPLSEKLLLQLRTYYRSLQRTNGWLFPCNDARRKDKPISDRRIWQICHAAALRAGIAKHVHPHTLRHSFATHLFDSGAELPVIQRLLGHADPRDTMIYLHLSTRTLRAAPNPLDTLEIDHLPPGRNVRHEQPTS